MSQPASQACLVLTRPVAADSPRYRVTKSPLKSPQDRPTAESSLKVRSLEKDHATGANKTNHAHSRGQHERTNGEHQRDAARRQSHSLGPRIHPWLTRAPVYCPGYAEVWKEMLLASGTSANNFFTGTRPCSDLAVLAAVVSVLHEAGPLSTAPVASVAPPDKRKKRRVSTRSRNSPQSRDRGAKYQ